MLLHYRLRRALSEPPTQPRRSLLDGLLQGRSRALKRVLRPKGMGAAFHERQLRLAAFGKAVQSMCRLDRHGLIIGAVNGQVRDSQVRDRQIEAVALAVGLDIFEIGVVDE